MNNYNGDGMNNENDTSNSNYASMNNGNTDANNVGSRPKMENKYKDYLPENRFPSASLGDDDGKGQLRKKLINAYIGSKYVEFINGGFSWCTFFFGWSYFLYRKLYKIGFIALLVEIIFIFNSLFGLKFFLISFLPFLFKLFLSFNLLGYNSPRLASKIKRDIIRLI